ncbi:hypothetical protein [Mycolicibacterium litorale]|uniref:Uncharacterized protein n=1 Tax=Mycolicibacterium litorale TaxID=758802 RepID=A0AAD1IH23_9MYCO|nr:hypothetical protein [Mycolicibacterium litorale]BBY15140.1 hypothetical protein MLIT_07320 [Mycolicibacterium litorale]
MLSLLGPLRPTPGAIDGRWALGIGDTLARLIPGPDPVRATVRLLNHFGGLAISDDELEFDGDSARWADVKEIETHKFAGYLLSGALDKQIDKLPVPWFPFRGLALGAASQAVLTLIVATVDGVFRGAFDVAIPAEVHYRGLLREKTLTPGMLATALLADPAVRKALIATAEAHGVEVRPADDDVLDAARQRARRLKGLLKVLRDSGSDRDEVVGVHGGPAHLGR